MYAVPLSSVPPDTPDSTTPPLVDAEREHIVAALNQPNRVIGYYVTATSSDATLLLPDERIFKCRAEKVEWASEMSGMRIRPTRIDNSVGMF